MIYLEHNGVTVYHVLRNGNPERPLFREFIFTTLPEAIHVEALGNERRRDLWDACFDARELPGGEALGRALFFRREDWDAEAETTRAVVRRAIDNGLVGPKNSEAPSPQWGDENMTEPWT